MSTNGREILAAHMRKTGASEALIAYRCRDDKPQWPENTIAGMYDEAAKWPERILSFAVNTEAGDDIRVKLSRAGATREWGSVLRLGGLAGDARERTIKSFCALTISQIEKLGNPRWDALVAEEAARV